MKSITIGGLEESVKKRLRIRAARHGRSMEGEAREILRTGAATAECEPNLAESIRAIFSPPGGITPPYIHGTGNLAENLPSSRLFTTTIPVAEVFYGLEIMPACERRNALKQAVDSVFDDRFASRIPRFDRDAARAFAEICAGRRKLGRPIGELDAQIAAIALSRGAAIATRNLDDLQDSGVELVDPWSYSN